MTENNETQAQAAAPQVSDKELNFRKQQQMYERQLEQERNARLQAEQRAAELERGKSVSNEDDDDDNEPYVDKKRLAKTTGKVKQEIKQETQADIKNAIQQALEADRRERWLEANPDFEETMSHADKLAQMDPELARSILSMPDNFARQQLVYRNIKLTGVNRPKAPEQSIQQKVDANRRSPYYQPSGQGSAPYGIANGGNNPSEAEGKNLYNQMQALKNRLRIN